jgi:RecA-family ATPase
MAGGRLRRAVGQQESFKTWMMADLAVSVASGGSWLGLYRAETPGRVLVFSGEGGKRKFVRRVRTICEEKRISVNGLPVRVCQRVPDLSSGEHLGIMQAELARTHPVLIVLDPFYPSAPSGQPGNLFHMGSLLASVQLIGQEAGAALCVGHHWNETGVGHGSHRASGAGPAEWGRVLVSVSVPDRSTDPGDRSTTALLRGHLRGRRDPRHRGVPAGPDLR